MSCRCLVWGAVGAAVLVAIPLCAQQGHPRTRRNNKKDESTAFNSTASAFSLDKGARASFGASPATVERTNIPLAGSSRPDPHGIEAPWRGLGGADTARGEEPGDRQDIILRIEFTGMRRIAPAALRARIASREGQPLDAARIANDVRALDRLGWVGSVSAEGHPLPGFLAETQTRAHSQPEWHGPNDPAVLAIESARLGTAAEPVEDINRPLALIASPERPRIGLLLLFVLEERPFLARVEFRGSRVLSRERIAAVLEQKRIALKLAAPANRTELWRAARDRKSTRLNSSHGYISYAVFCLKKKKKQITITLTKDEYSLYRVD